jgi:hypothetical protein
MMVDRPATTLLEKKEWLVKELKALPLWRDNITELAITSFADALSGKHTPGRLSNEDLVEVFKGLFIMTIGMSDDTPEEMLREFQGYLARAIFVILKETYTRGEAERRYSVLLEQKLDELD